MSYVEEIDRLTAEVDQYRDAVKSLTASVRATAKAERERDEARAALDRVRAVRNYYADRWPEFGRAIDDALDGDAS